MLYLDASALVKRYFTERGSRALNAKFELGEQIYTSLLSYGEVHATMSRAYRTGKLNAIELSRIREAFESDWSFGLSALDVNIQTMSALPKLVAQYPLKAGDAIHLSTAFWLRDTLRLQGHPGLPGNLVEFGVADKRLGVIAVECGLQVFNPELHD